MKNGEKYYLVRSDVLPEVFLKVMEAKELLETGECSTVAEAAVHVGISRSAFYKYRDAISNFRNMRQSEICTFHVMLRDRAGLLSALLTIFAARGANILTINQSIPSNGAALVVISADMSGMDGSSEELLIELRSTQGVIKADILAG